MIKSTDLSWLAAVIEAEGSISIQTHIKSHNGFLIATPFIVIVNNDVGIIHEILRICCDLAIKARSVTRKQSTTVNVRIDGIKAVESLLGYIKGYMRSAKQGKALLVNDFMDSRKQKLQGPGQKILYYSRYEIELIHSIRANPLALTVDQMLACPNVLS